MKKKTKKNVKTLDLEPPLHTDKTLWVRTCPLPEPRPGSPLQTTSIHYSPPSLLSEFSSEHGPWFLVEATNPGRFPPTPNLSTSRFAPKLFIVYSVIHPSTHAPIRQPTHTLFIHQPTHTPNHTPPSIHPPTPHPHPSIHPLCACVRVYVCLCVCLSVCLSVSMSVCE